MNTSKSKSTGAEEHGENNTGYSSAHNDSIEPGTPFPEPEVKPAIVSQTPVGSQVGVVGESGIADGSMKGNTPTS